LDKIREILKSCIDIPFSEDRYGFLKQIDPEPFKYTAEYKNKQSTNNAMSWLRLGWLSAQIPFDQIKKFNTVDIGSGNGIFVNEGRSVFKRIVPYDLTGESISETELYSTAWDLVVMSDVLEHYHNIDDFWTLSFQYAMVSFPETPRSRMNLEHWRHYKPNEHIYMLNTNSFIDWVKNHGCSVVAYGTPEDMIRCRWDDAQPNITTFLIKRDAVICD